MSRLLLPVLTFFLFVFEGTVMQLFVPEMFGEHYIVVPRFALVIILFIACFQKRSTALWYGMIFGLLMDVVYTDYLGVYLFVFGFTAYVIASIAAVSRKNVWTVVCLIVLGLTMQAFQIFGLYTIIGIAQMSAETFIQRMLWPTLVLNVIVSLLLYYPLQKHFRTMAAQKAIAET